MCSDKRLDRHCSSMRHILVCADVVKPGSQWVLLKFRDSTAHLVVAPLGHQGCVVGDALRPPDAALCAARQVVLMATDHSGSHRFD